MFLFESTLRLALESKHLLNLSWILSFHLSFASYAHASENVVDFLLFLTVRWSEVVTDDNTPHPLKVTWNRKQCGIKNHNRVITKLQPNFYKEMYRTFT